MVVYRLDNRGVVKWGKRIGTAEGNDLNEMVMSSDGNIGLLGKAKFDGTTYGLHLTTLTTDG